MDPNTTMLIRNSERQSFKRCRQQWRWAYVDGLTPNVAAPALRFGDLIHQALAAHFLPGVRRGPHPAETFAKLYEAQLDEAAKFGFRDDDEKWHEASGVGDAMLRGYVEEFGAADSEYKVISSERTFQWPVKIGRERDGKTIHIVGTLDGVWQHRQTKDIIFKEFKTAASINPDGLAMDEQAGVYWTYGPAVLRKEGIMKKGQQPVGVLYTFLRKAVPDARPKNELGQCLNQPSVDDLLQGLLDAGKPHVGKKTKAEVIATAEKAKLDWQAWGEVSKSQPAPLFHRQFVYRDQAERTRMHNRIIAEARDMIAVRADVSDGDGESAYKNPGPLHMPNCRGCAFRDMCELHETGSDWEAMRDGTMKTWDPYDSHHITERA